ncbi:MAG: hypothetical protein ACPGVG_12490 [Mycobacterium sp.]
MKITVTLLLPMVVLLACSSPSEPVKAEPAVNRQQIVERYTTAIWPATSAYNADHSQGGSASKQFHAVIEPILTSSGGGIEAASAYSALREAAQKLGRMNEYDTQTQTSHYNDGLHMKNVRVTSVNGNTATLMVCYTYTDFWYVNIQDTQHSAAASEATAQLVKVDNTWYLRAITNDHVVPDCSDSTA